jgi:hypothetical protein
MRPTLESRVFGIVVGLAVPLSASSHESAATTLNHDAGLFPTDLDDIASRLDAAARLTIASHGASSDAKQSPTKHRPDESEIGSETQSNGADLHQQ